MLGVALKRSQASLRETAHQEVPHVRRILLEAVVLLLLVAPGAALADDVMVHVGHNRLDPAEIFIRVVVE